MKLNEKSKLTGKASFDFLIKHGRIGYLQDSVQNALIVDWFDSVGIYVAVEWFGNNWIFSVEKVPFKAHHYRDFGFNSRIEATNAAILKANELYNSQNK